MTKIIETRRKIAELMADGIARTSREISAEIAMGFRATCKNVSAMTEMQLLARSDQKKGQSWTYTVNKQKLRKPAKQKPVATKNFESIYGQKMRKLCYMEGHRKGLPRGINNACPREERDERIVDYISRNPNAAAPAIVKATGISEGSIADYLSRLTLEKVIKRHLDGRFKTYSLARVTTRARINMAMGEID